MMWKYDKVHTEFEKCAREHLNNNDIRQKLYRKGLSIDEFRAELSEVILPVFQSAKNIGFGKWMYSGK